MDHNRVDFLVKILDNFEDFGAFRDAIYNPLERATNEAMIRQFNAAQRITEILNKHYPQKEMRKWYKQWLYAALSWGTNE